MERPRTTTAKKTRTKQAGDNHTLPIQSYSKGSHGKFMALGPSPRIATFLLMAMAPLATVDGPPPRPRSAVALNR